MVHVTHGPARHEDGHPPAGDDIRTRADAGIDRDVANLLLLTDFEQAFVVHNLYQESERELFKLSLRILAFPFLIAGALVSAGLVASTSDVGEVFELPFIWAALIVAALLNAIVVRSYVVTDRVQTEAKHQVNRLRGLYLDALRHDFPPGWEPVWGKVNAYLDTKVKLKAAVMTPLILGIINAAYFGYGIDRLVAGAGFPLHLAVSLPLGCVALAVQMELTWEIARRRLIGEQADGRGSGVPTGSD